MHYAGGKEVEIKALIVSGDKFEDTELLVPLYRLLEEKIETDIASLSATTITGKHGYKVVATIAIDQVDPSSYDLLVLPGGKAPATLRKNEELLAIVRQFFTEGKMVAAICHGPQILVSASVLHGRHVTCYKSVAEEVEKAGGHYSDCEVMVDGNLITSRVPKDLPVFMREIIKQCEIRKSFQAKKRSSRNKK